MEKEKMVNYIYLKSIGNETSTEIESKILTEYNRLPNIITTDNANFDYSCIFDLISEYSNNFSYSKDYFIKVFTKLNFSVKYLPGFFTFLFVILTGISYANKWPVYLDFIFLVLSITFLMGSYKFDNKGMRLADKLYNSMRTGNLLGLFLSKDVTLHTTHKEFKSDQSAELVDVIKEHSLKKIIAEKVVYDIQKRNKKIDENILNAIALLIVFPSDIFDAKFISEKLREAADRIAIFGDSISINYLRVFGYYIIEDWAKLNLYCNKISERMKIVEIELYKSLSEFMLN